MNGLVLTFSLLCMSPLRFKEPSIAQLSLAYLTIWPLEAGGTRARLQKLLELTDRPAEMCAVSFMGQACMLPIAGGAR